MTLTKVARAKPLPHLCWGTASLSAPSTCHRLFAAIFLVTRAKPAPGPASGSVSPVAADTAGCPPYARGPVSPLLTGPPYCCEVRGAQQKKHTWYVGCPILGQPFLPESMWCLLTPRPSLPGKTSPNCLSSRVFRDQVRVRLPGYIYIYRPSEKKERKEQGIALWRPRRQADVRSPPSGAQLASRARPLQRCVFY